MDIKGSNDKINIERGVKQRDALSCSFLILCIEPLIRNLNGNKKIEPRLLNSKMTNTLVEHKASVGAYDIAKLVKIICYQFKKYLGNMRG